MSVYCISEIYLIKEDMRYLADCLDDLAWALCGKASQEMEMAGELRCKADDLKCLATNFSLWMQRRGFKAISGLELDFVSKVEIFGEVSRMDLEAERHERAAEESLHISGLLGDQSRKIRVCL